MSGIFLTAIESPRLYYFVVFQSKHTSPPISTLVKLFNLLPSKKVCHGDSNGNRWCLVWTYTVGVIVVQYGNV